jgi:hypothetical protein
LLISASSAAANSTGLADVLAACFDMTFAFKKL